MNLKQNGERFEQRIKVKMIIESIMKVLLKSGLIYSFELFYSHGVWDHQFEYVFNEETQKSSFSCTFQIFGFEKMLLLLLRNIF